MRTTAKYGPFDLTALNENTKMIMSQDYRTAVFTLVAEDTPACTLKFYTSRQEGLPDLTATADNSNIYSTSVAVNLEDLNNVEGDTGVVIGAVGITQYEINQNGNFYVGCKVTAYTSGNVKVYIDLFDNQ